MGMIGDHQEEITVKPKQEPIPSAVPMPSVEPAQSPAPTLVPA